MAAVSEEVVEHKASAERRSFLDRIMRTVEIAEAVVGGLLLVTVLALVMIQVILRFTPTAGWAWTGELAKFGLVWMAFILSGYLMGRDEHVKIDIIDHFLPGRALRIVKAVAWTITAAICIAAVYEGYHLVTNQVGIKSPAAQIPMSAIYAVPMIGMGLTAIRCLLNIVTRRTP